MIFPETRWGADVKEDEWTDEFGAGQRCPKCGAPDYHLDPSEEDPKTGKTIIWEVCECCGYSVRHSTGEVMIEGDEEKQKRMKATH